MNHNRAPLGQRITAAVAGVLIALALSTAGAVGVGAAAGWVWRWVCFGFEWVR